MRQIKNNIPNFVTSLNLLSGCFSIVAAANDQILWAAYLIGIAAVFDFLDGLVARVLNATSEIGKQLDSLADMLSFGLAPGFILFQMISVGFGHYFTPLLDRPAEVLVYSSLAFLFTVFAAVRLANFNIDTRQTHNFRGLPTPASALFVASLIPVIIMEHRLNPYIPPTPEMLEQLWEHFWFREIDIWTTELLFNPFFYVGVSVVLSALMVSGLPVLSFKFKKLKSIDHIPRLLIIVLSLWLFWEYEYMGVPIAIAGYIVIAILYGLIDKYLINKNNYNEIQS